MLVLRRGEADGRHAHELFSRVAKYPGHRLVGLKDDPLLRQHQAFGAELRDEAKPLFAVAQRLLGLAVGREIPEREALRATLGADGLAGDLGDEARPVAPQHRGLDDLLAPLREATGQVQLILWARY